MDGRAELHLSRDEEELSNSVTGGSEQLDE